MSRYIDADKLEEKFMQMARSEWKKPTMLNNGSAFSELADIVNKFPAANAVEVRHGNWVGIDDFPHETWECDRCGRIIEGDRENYCPNCGSRMDLDEVTE